MKCIVLCVLIVVSLARNAHAQTLDDASVDAAIKAGQTKKFSHLISDCVATSGYGESIGASMAGGVQRTGAFNVVVSTAPGRIAGAAADAKRLYKPFSVDTVPSEMRDISTVFVTAVPQKPKASGNTIDVASPIERIVLKSKTNPAAVVQPERVEVEPVEWANLVGGKVQANSAWATFPIGSIRELPAGDVDVVLITEAGERRCKIGVNDRVRLLK